MHAVGANGSPYYRDDLALVHHLGFGSHADACAPGILARLEPARERGGLVLELGCGSGHLTRHLVEAGHRVLATDASTAMLALRRAVPGRGTVRTGRGSGGGRAQAVSTDAVPGHGLDVRRGRVQAGVGHRPEPGLDAENGAWRGSAPACDVMGRATARPSLPGGTQAERMSRGIRVHRAAPARVG